MTKRNVFSNLIWRFSERICAELVSFVVTMIIARILDPSVYGLTALVTVFISILGVFINGGFGTALVQKKAADELDFSSVFWFNIVMCSSLYIVMFLAAPYIALFYRIPELVNVVRVMSLTLIISGVKSIQIAYVSKTMQFKKFFFATLGGTIGAGVVGIVMALKGFGVWALIVQSLFNNTVDTVILWLTVNWRPKYIFSFERMVRLFSFGWKMLVSSLLDTVYNNIRSLIIGKKYTTADLAQYNRGRSWPDLLVSNINSSIDSVLFPTLSAEQDDRTRVRELTRRAIKTSSFILMPMMVGLAVCAEPLVRLLLTEKWLPSVFFMRIFCFTYAFYPVHTANLTAIKAMGRSDLFLRLEIIKKIVGLIALGATMFISVKAMALSLLVTSVLSQMINSWPNKKLLEYRYADQLKDMLPQICLSGVMGFIVYQVGLFDLNDWLTLFVQVPLGMFIYIIGSKMLHIDSFEYVLEILKNYKGK